MADNQFVETLKTIRADLVSERREFATGALNNANLKGLTKAEQLAKFIETQSRIDAIDRAIEDERRNGDGYTLANV